MFSSSQSVNKIENLQKRALRFLYDDFEASYEDLLSKGGKSKTNVRRLRTLCVKIYKTLNDLNPSFMNNIFKLKINGREVQVKLRHTQMELKIASSESQNSLHKVGTVSDDDVVDEVNYTINLSSAKCQKT